jgi:hypothetical protein
VAPSIAPAQRVVDSRLKAYLHVMPETVVPPALSRPLLAAAGAATLALAGTVLLWAHYGATVFFETIRAGFVACFG